MKASTLKSPQAKSAPVKSLRVPKLRVPKLTAKQELFEAALEVRLNAYVPYSGHRVGAAIRVKGGKIYSGCNVENSSYGATVCAERNAIFSAVAAQGAIEIEEILVITDASPPWPPCGMCRQVIAEFGMNSKVHITNLKGQNVTLPFAKLLPSAFNKSFMTKGSKKR